MTKSEPEHMPPLTPAVFHVLLALAGGERHGYAIMQDVAESTGGHVRMGPGTLYGTIRRLLVAQMIEESDQRVSGGMKVEENKRFEIPFSSGAFSSTTSR